MADDGLANDFDPGALVGQINDKVDAIKHVLDKIDFAMQFWVSRREAMDAKISALRTNHNRLKDYVAVQMGQRHFEKLPGDEWYVRLQKSAPALEILRPPTEMDMTIYPYVQMQVAYNWNKELIKNDMLKGAFDGADFARIRNGAHIRFYLNTEATNVPAKQ